MGRLTVCWGAGEAVAETLEGAVAEGAKGAEGGRDGSLPA